MTTPHKPAVKGTAGQRRDLRTQVREANRARHVTKLMTEASEAGDYRRLVVITCNAALTVSKRLTPEGRRLLAIALGKAIDSVDTSKNRKEMP